MRKPTVEASFAIDVDIVASDRDDRLILVAAVSARKPREEQAAEVEHELPTWDPGSPNVFVMLVDLEDIRIFLPDEPPVAVEPDDHQVKSTQTLCLGTSLKTAAVLSHYDAEFAQKPIYRDYLETLVEAWLRDLAFHWKSATPPGADQLAAIGLLPRLEGGFAEAWRWPDANPLS